jgi:hypothetical protein
MLPQKVAVCPLGDNVQQARVGHNLASPRENGQKAFREILVTGA